MANYVQRLKGRIEILNSALDIAHEDSEKIISDIQALRNSAPDQETKTKCNDIERKIRASVKVTENIRSQSNI